MRKSLKLILLVLFTLSAVGSSFDEDTPPSSNRSNGFVQGKYTGTKAGRMKREAFENIKEFLDRASALARITNGISLQNGLLDEKIPIVSAAEELLNFGSVDITKINLGKVKKFASKITEVKENLIKLKNKKAEKALATIDGIQRSLEERAKEMDKIEGYDEYFDGVGEFVKLDLEKVNKMNSLANELISKLTGLKQLHKNYDIDDAIRDVNIFLGSLGFYKGYFAPVIKFQKQLQGLSHLNNASKIFQPFKSFIHLVKQRPSDSIVSLELDIASFLELVALTVSSKTHTESVFNLLRSRENPTISERKYTAGLSNGFSELGGLNQEIKNPLLESLLKKDVSKLLEGLKPIDSIQNDFGDTDELFRGFSSSAFLDIHLLRDELLKNSLKKEEADSVLKLIEDRLSKPVPTTDAAQTILSNIDEFPKMIGALKAWAHRVTGEDLAAAIREFESLIPFKDVEKATPSQIQEFIKTLKEGDAASKLKTAIDKAQFIPPEYTTDNIMSAAKAIKKSELDEFRNGQEVKDELKFYSDLRQEKGRKLMNSIETIKVIRSFDQNQMTQLTLMADTISKATKNLNGMKSVVPKMKTNMNSESDQLKKEDLIATSRTIGHAVSGVRKMYALATTDLKDIDELVAKALKNLSDPQKKTELEEGWRSFTTSSATSIQKINEFDSRIQLKKLKTISDFGSQFTDADTIPDVVLPMDTFDDLIRNVQDPDVKKNLKEEREILEGLDLKFSNHHQAFDGSLVEFKSLEDSLNKFFDSEANLEKPGIPIFWIVVCFLFILLVILVGIFFICYCNSNCLLAKRLEERKNKTGLVEEGQLLLNKNGVEKKEQVDQEKKKKEEAEAAAKKKKEEEEAAAKKKKEEEEAAAKKKKEEEEAAAKKNKDNEKAEAKGKKEDPKLVDHLDRSLKALNSSLKKHMDEALILEIGRSIPNCVVNLPKELQAKEAELAPGLGGQKIRALRWMIKHTFEDASMALASIHTSMQRLTAQHADLEKPTLGKGDGAAARYETEMKLYREEASKRYGYLSESKHRNVPLLENFNINGLERDGKEVRIHANRISSPYGVEYIATQGPIAADEGLMNQHENENPKDDTRADFWLMAWNEGTENIVMLCNFKETLVKRKNGITETITKPKCGKYFSDDMNNPEIQCGEFTIKTISEEKMFPDENNNPNVVIRKLQVTHSDGRSRIFTHYHVTDWPDGSVPNYSPDKLWLIIKAVKKSTNKPIIVHCSSGIGRTMVYIGIDVETDMVLHNEVLHLGDALDHIRSHRARGIQTFRQGYYLLSGINNGVCTDSGLKIEHHQKREEVRERLMTGDNIKKSPVWTELYKDNGDPKGLSDGRINFHY